MTNSIDRDQWLNVTSESRDRNSPFFILNFARTSISRTSALKWPAIANIDFTHYYEAAKCHFDGSELKKKQLNFRIHNTSMLRNKYHF
jgi:hypothetical protein